MNSHSFDLILLDCGCIAEPDPDHRRGDQAHTCRHGHLHAIAAADGPTHYTARLIRHAPGDPT